MRAYRIAQQGGPATWQNVTVPTPGLGEVLLEMKAAGICASDLEITITARGTLRLT